MHRKKGLAAALAAAVAAVLVFAILAVIKPGTDDPERTNPPSPSPSRSPSPSSPSPRVSLEFVVSSFNVLGGSHTAPGGPRTSMAPGETRIQWVAQLLARHDVDVVGLQEFQVAQARAFQEATGSMYDLHPGVVEDGRATQNSIAWRTDTWEKVEAGSVPIPYFNGNDWPMPFVLLRNKETGLSAYFMNFHNPASTKRHPEQRRWRRIALAREVALVNRLTSANDHPVFLTGDLNERKNAFCTITGRTSLVAANGGSNNGACRPPAGMGIDWIFGSSDVTFTDYRALRGGLVEKTSDHPMVIATAKITN